ncbi:MAG TPA: winged helix-turn-helix domain-containing protein [Vicinamibacterales bacterium]|jgi:TolB-like protein/DNA-binding winged helix-turn-helix (wHTH) protein/Flp pilus assembly protein TadD|nr:winged helix-turn-helix domain-containing protein [Vicinamibacterales bacterium]
MALQKESGGVVRFEPFELDARKGELRKHGVKLKLQDQPLQVLVALLDRAGEVVTREELRAQLWPADTFVDFDHSLNAAVNRLRDCLGDGAERPRFIETVPRRGYRFIAPVARMAHPNGDTAVLLPAEEPVASAVDVKTPGVPARARRPTGREWTLGILVLGVVAMAAWLGMRTSRPGTGATVDRVMLAVLPLEDLSADPQGSYFSDGVTEDIITELGGLEPRHLGVIARTSVMQYRKTSKPIDQIGRELGVQYVLEGSLRRTADHVRVTAQLIQVRDQTHLWAKSFDRDVRDILALQRDLARAVASDVAANFSGTVAESALEREPVNPEALDLYLRGRAAWNRRTEEDIRNSIPLYEAALAKDPRYARAYGGLADAYLVLSSWALGALPPSEGYSKGRIAATKALELDETLAEAHTSLGAISAFYDWNTLEARKEFRRAIELNPSYATAHHWLAEHLATIGQFDQMLVENQEALKLDPLSPIIVTGAANRYCFINRCADAAKQLQAVTTSHPEFLMAHGFLGTALTATHHYADSIRELETAANLSSRKSEELAELAHAYGASGRPGDARKIVTELEERSQRMYVPAYSLALAYAGLGNNDRAFDLLEQAYREHSSWLSHVRIDRRLDSLRSDPRFQALQARVGL